MSTILRKFDYIGTSCQKVSSGSQAIFEGHRRQDCYLRTEIMQCVVKDLLSDGNCSATGWISTAWMNLEHSALGAVYILSCLRAREFPQCVCEHARRSSSTDYISFARQTLL